MSLTAFAPEIESLKTTDSIWSFAVEALTAEGIDDLIYLTVDQDKSDPVLLTTCPQIYEGVEPTEDPFLEYCCHNYELTKTGPAYLAGHDYLPPEAVAFIKRAAKTAFNAGMGIPVRIAGSKRFGGFNIGIKGTAEELERDFIPRFEEFRFFCLLIHRRLEDLLQEHGVPPSNAALLDDLSPREREIVNLIAQGLSRKECARACGITPNTAAEYTKSAYRKLGISNRAEVAAFLATGNVT